jgi:hypothetical protein
MKINLTEEEKFEIRMFIDRYRSISVNVENLKKEAEKIQGSISDEQLKLKEIKKEEDEFMEILHKKYGNFSLQDINDSISK